MPDDVRFVPDGRDCDTGYYERTDGERAVHLVRYRGDLLYSGHNGSGDQSVGQGERPRGARRAVAYAAVIDVGGGMRYITTEGRLIVSRVSKTEGFTPEGLLVAARSRMFGFRVVTEGNADGSR